MNIEVSKSRWTSRVEFFIEFSYFSNCILIDFEIFYFFFLNQLNGIGKVRQVVCLLSSVQ